MGKGMTLGKWISGERVVNKTSGKNPGFFIMLTRETVGKIISALFMYIGFLWAIWDKDGQAWHDKFVDTVVVCKQCRDGKVSDVYLSQYYQTKQNPPGV